MSETRTTPRRAAAALDAFERAARAQPCAGRARVRTLAPGLVEALSPVVRRSVVRALRRRARRDRDVDQEVDDFVQIVLLALFTKGGALEAWSPDRAHHLRLDRFVALVATHSVDSALRTRRRNPWSEEPALAETLDAKLDTEPGPGPETLAHARRMLHSVSERLCARLSPRGRAIFEMLFLQERAPEEVAAALGMRVPAVRAWRSRLSCAARAIAAELERPALATIMEPPRLLY